MIIETALAVMCICGEAENQGKTGLDALAHALNNRGSTIGVYGCTRVPKTPYSPEIKTYAKRAWLTVDITKDPTKGADHWGTDADLKKFKKTKWFKKAYGFIKIKDHMFFRVDNR